MGTATKPENFISVPGSSLHQIRVFLGQNSRPDRYIGHVDAILSYLDYRNMINYLCGSYNMHIFLFKGDKNNLWISDVYHKNEFSNKNELTYELTKVGDHSEIVTLNRCKNQ